MNKNQRIAEKLQWMATNFRNIAVTMEDTIKILTEKDTVVAATHLKCPTLDGIGGQDATVPSRLPDGKYNPDFVPSTVPMAETHKLYTPLSDSADRGQLGLKRRKQSW